MRCGPWYGRNTVCAARVRMSRRERQRRDSAQRQKVSCVCVTLTFEWEAEECKLYAKGYTACSLLFGVLCTGSCILCGM